VQICLLSPSNDIKTIVDWKLPASYARGRLLDIWRTNQFADGRLEDKWCRAWFRLLVYILLPL